MANSSHYRNCRSGSQALASGLLQTSPSPFIIKVPKTSLALKRRLYLMMNSWI